MKTLSGHTSPETAYVVSDYPYGFRLRCKMRYWIETRPGYGQRMVSQSTNPKKPIEVWNKPKAGTYHSLAVMYLDEKGHVALAAISGYDDEEKILAFEKAHGTAFGEYEQKAIRYMLARVKGMKHVTWDVHVAKPGEEPQSKEEQKAILRAAVAQGFRELKEEGR